eukprot:353518-Chlamydomonas_euryale.AAC.6
MLPDIGGWAAAASPTRRSLGESPPAAPAAAPGTAATPSCAPPRPSGARCCPPSGVLAAGAPGPPSSLTAVAAASARVEAELLNCTPVCAVRQARQDARSRIEEERGVGEARAVGRRDARKAGDWPARRGGAAHARHPRHARSRSVTLCG